MMLWNCYTQYFKKFGNLSSGHRTGKGQFSFHSQRKEMPKNVQTTTQLHSSHMLLKQCSRFKIICYKVDQKVHIILQYNLEIFALILCLENSPIWYSLNKSFFDSLSFCFKKWKHLHISALVFLISFFFSPHLLSLLTIHPYPRANINLSTLL